MVAKSSVTTSSAIAQSSPMISPTGTGSQSCAKATSARTKMLSDSDTSSTKPMPSTTASDRRRVLRWMNTPLRVGRGATPQIALSDSCIWVNTVVAPNTMAPTPAIVGSSPLCWMRLLTTAVWIAAATSGPIATSSCSAMRP